MSLSCDLYSQSGAKKGTLTLSENVFGKEVRADLMHRLLVLQQANRRNPIAHTKTRGEVDRTKKKFVRQKGTGGARHGARNTNVFKGGGVTFGPRNTRNFSLMMPQAQRQMALCSAFSEKAKSAKVLGLESYKTEKPKTKDVAQLIEKMGVVRSALILIPERNDSLYFSARNLPNVKVLTVAYANIEDLLKYDNLILLEDSAKILAERFTPKTK